MHGEVRGVPWRADPDLVGRMDRGLEKKNCKHDNKALFHFLPLRNLKLIQQSLIFPKSEFLLLLPQPLAYLMTLSALASTSGGIGTIFGFSILDFRLFGHRITLSALANRFGVLLTQSVSPS